MADKYISQITPLGSSTTYLLKDKKAIENIIRSGTTFTATRRDGTTFTFTQQDNNTIYTFASGTNGSFSVTPSGGSAQTISIGKPATAGTADVANSVAWSNITGKPNSFTPSSHTHYELATQGDNRTVATTPNDYVNRLVFRGLKTNSSFGSPSSDTYSYVVGLRGWSDSSGGHAHELAFNNTGIYWRSGATTSWGNWYRIYTTGNKPTKSDVGLGNVTNDAQIPKSIGTTKGDIIYWSAANTPARLSIGSAGQVLKVSSNGVPIWSNDNNSLNWGQITQSGANNIEEGTSNFTDNTEIFSSYASNNGFADTNATGKVYRRDAVKMYNYIQTKLAITNNNVSVGWNTETTIATIGGTAIKIKIPANPNTNTATAADNILDGSNSGTQITYAPYSAQQSKLSFDTSITNPTRTDRLNLNGYLYATKVYSGGAEVLTAHQSLANYKTKQTAISDNTGTSESTTATRFIYSVSQNENGEISVKTRPLPTYNNYSLPLAANGTRGGIQIGYSESGNNYAVKLSSEKAYVTVPWTDYKVRQTNDTSNTNYRVLLSYAANNDQVDNITHKSGNLIYNPSANKLSTGNMDLTGVLTVTGQTNLNDNLNAQGITATNLLVTGATNFVQSPTAPTPASGDNSTKLATTEFVKTSVAGLSGAMHFKGTTTTEMTDGRTTAAVTIGGSSYTPIAGDVVLYSDSEFVWTGSAWERFGRDSSFKITQSAVDSGTAATNKWVSRIQQNANGEITATMGTLDTSGTWSGKAARLTDLNSSDSASSTTDWRKVWFSYSNGVTGRPALSDTLAFQTSTGTLKATIFSGSGASLTSLNASNISSGTLAAARLPSVTRANNTSTASPAHSGTFTTIDSITTDTYGRVTAVNTKTITLPSDNNTDVLVKQTAKTDNKNYKLLLTSSDSPTSGAAAEASYDTSITVNPSTHNLQAGSYNDSINMYQIRAWIKTGPYEAGWKRVCALTSFHGYGIGTVYINGYWSSEEPTLAAFEISFSHTNYAHIKQTLGARTTTPNKVRLVYSGTGGKWYFDIHIPARTGSGSTGNRYVTFVGRLTVSEIDETTNLLTEEPTTTTVTRDLVITDDQPAITVDLASTSTGLFTGADMTTGISGTLGTAHGGTGNTSFTANRLIYTSAANKLSSSNIVSDGSSIGEAIDGGLIILNQSDYDCSTLVGTSGDTTAFRTGILKQVAAKHNRSNPTLFMGTYLPNTKAWMIGHVYNPNDVDSTSGLPRYSTFLGTNLASKHPWIFGTKNYVEYEYALASSSKDMWINQGTTNRLAYYSAAGAIASYSSTKGGTKKLWYLNAGVPTDSTETVGDAGQPIYLNTGTLTSIDWHIGNKNVGEHNANNIKYNMIGYYTSNGPAKETSYGFQGTDGAIYVQGYNSSWVGQIAQDYQTGGLAVRGLNNGTWTSWLQIPTMITESYPALLNTKGTNGWIKIGTANTSYGLLPSQAGNAGSGHNYLGTSTWYWKYAYIDEIYGALTGNATTATTLQTARTINGTSFNGSANITTANWGTARTLTIGATGKSVNGSANISWSMDEIMGSSDSTKFYRGDKTWSNTLTGYIGATGFTRTDDCFVLAPEGGYYKASASTPSITGALKITLPKSWTSTMMSFQVDIYNYNDNNASTYTIAGYNFTGRNGYWTQCSASSIGRGNKSNLKVRFGHDGTKCCIFIGEIDTTWSYPQINIHDFMGRYSGGVVANWSTGWNLSFVTVFPENIDIEKTNPNVLPITYGGTGATTAAEARTNLGLGSMATETAADYILKSIGTTKGDIIYWSAASTPARLGAGSTGQVLKISSNGVPVWSNDNNSITSVKGNAESSYRTGNVNLTPTNILGTGTTAQFWRGDNNWSNILSGAHTKSLATFVATAGSDDAWNKAGNYNLALVSSNNMLAFTVGGTSNDRNANVQVGHNNDTSYGHITGNLYLNKLGGQVYINNNYAAKVTSATSGQIMVADGTTGGIKTTGYTIATSVPSGAVFTDTKNTAGSTDTSSKIFLIGATSQSANPQTYSDNEVFVTSGVLTAKTFNSTSLTASQAVSTDASKNLVSTNLTVSDPTASGTGITYIATISQSSVGKITATKSTVRSASTSQTGVVQLSSATNSTSETLAATAKAVKTVYDLANNHKYWANVESTSAASYNKAPEVANIKINGNTSASAASTKNVQLVYDSTLEVLNFVFS